MLFIFTVADNTEKLDQRKSEDSIPAEEIKRIYMDSSICGFF